MTTISRSDPSTISARVERTISYMESPRGRANWERNRDQFSFPYAANLCAAIQAATGLIVYERIMEVYYAVGPALMARGGKGRAA